MTDRAEGVLEPVGQQIRNGSDAVAAADSHSACDASDGNRADRNSAETVTLAPGTGVTAATGGSDIECRKCHHSIGAAGGYIVLREDRHYYVCDDHLTDNVRVQMFPAHCPVCNRRWMLSRRAMLMGSMQAEAVDEFLCPGDCRDQADADVAVTDPMKSLPGRDDLQSVTPLLCGRCGRDVGDTVWIADGYRMVTWCGDCLKPGQRYPWGAYTKDCRTCGRTWYGYRLTMIPNACPGECRRRDHNATRQHGPVLKAHTCEHCGEEFISNRSHAKYCSPAHRQAAHRARAT